MGFIKITLVDIIDILMVATIMYYIYKLIRGTNATSILTGIVLIYFSWVVARALNMELMSGILGDVVSVGLIALIVIFQAEIRKFLQSIGDRGQQSGPLNMLRKLLFPKQAAKHVDIEASINPIVKACGDMSATLTGALIVIKQAGSLDDVVASGVEVDARISDSLVRNIFFKNSPLHDGAMVIENGRIRAAKCVLPSTKSEVPLSFGMRHRAAVGLCEESDAIVIVVSEETGGISVAHNGKIRRGLSAIELKAELIRFNHEHTQSTDEPQQPELSTADQQQEPSIPEEKKQEEHAIPEEKQ